MRLRSPGSHAPTGCSFCLGHRDHELGRAGFCVMPAWPICIFHPAAGELGAGDVWPESRQATTTPISPNAPTTRMRHAGKHCPGHLNSILFMVRFSFDVFIRHGNQVVKGDGGVARRISETTSSTICVFRHLSSRRTVEARWARTFPASRLHPARRKRCPDPPIAATACAARNNPSEPRGLEPSSNAGCFARGPDDLPKP